MFGDFIPANHVAAGDVYVVISDVEIVEDDTILLCPMQHYSGWTFEKAAILSGGSIATNKSGTTCYIIFGQACKIGSDDVAKHAIKKLTSNSVTIENNSEKVCRLVKIYKWVIAGYS